MIAFFGSLDSYLYGETIMKEATITVGASIEDAGKRAFNIVPVEAKLIVDKMIRYVEQEWRAGQQIL